MNTEEIKKLAEHAAELYSKRLEDKYDNGNGAFKYAYDFKTAFMECAEHMGMMMKDRLEHGNFVLGREESNAVVKVCREYMNQATLFPDIAEIDIKSMDGSRFSVLVSTINYTTNEERNIYTEWKDGKVCKKEFHFIECEED